MGEVIHGLEMLRHWWNGKQEARDAWLAHLERYVPRLEESVVALTTALFEARRETLNARYLGDNHHNAATCPHCGDLVGRAQRALAEANATAAEACLERDAALASLRATRQPT
jgi:hypothetical protein